MTLSLKRLLLLLLLLVNSSHLCAQNDKKTILKDSVRYYYNEAIYKVYLNSSTENTHDYIDKAEKIEAKYPEFVDSYVQAIKHYITANSLFSINDVESCLVEVDKMKPYLNELKSGKLKAMFYEVKSFVYSRNNIKKAINFRWKSIEEIEKIDKNLDDYIYKVPKHLMLIDNYYTLAVNYGINFNRKALKNITVKELLKDSSYIKLSFCAKKAIKLVDESQTRFGARIGSEIYLSKAYLRVNELELAKTYIDMLSKENKDMDYPSKIALNQLYIDYFGKKEDYKTAFSFTKNLDTLHTKNVATQREKLEKFIDTEVVYLTKGLKRELLEADIELVNSKKIRNIVLVIFLIFLIIGGIFVYNILRKSLAIRKETREILIQKNKVLEKTLNDKTILEDRIININKFIAQDLHDNFGNRISGIINSSQILDDIIENGLTEKKVFKKFLHLLNKSAHTLVGDLKDLIWCNDQKNNELREIVKRVEKMTSEIYKVHNISFEFEKNFDEGTKLPPLWNRQLLLIIKEAINNSVKYSKIKNIKIYIKVEENYKLHIYVEDKGKGFNIDDTTRMSGLYNMQKRAQSIDCEIKIESKINVGTRVEIIGDILK